VKIGPRYFLLIVALAVWASLPLFLPRNLVDLLVFAGIFSIAGLGIGLLLGHCGIASLAQGMFYGLGAYASAYCSITFGAHAIVGFVVGLAVAAGMSLLVGWPVLRLTGFFLALATLCLAVIGNALFFEWDWLTGGSLGIGGIPKIQFFGFAFDTPGRYYYLVWILAFICMRLGFQLITSRNGLMMQAVRDSPDAALSLGIDIQVVRTRIFVLCSMFGSLAGSLFAHYTSFASVESFTIERSITFLLIPVIGGVSSVTGVIVGALFVIFVPELFSKLGDFHQILFGLALVFVVIVMPGGIVGAVRRLSVTGRRNTR
jgi:ABC-type branched-subunit amino acid transport system permease subunit